MSLKRTVENWDPATHSATWHDRDHIVIGFPDGRTLGLEYSWIQSLPPSQGRTALLLSLPDRPDPTQPEELSQWDLDVRRYERREAAFVRLKAELGAYNLGRVRSGEFTAEQMRLWLDSAECQDVFALLRRLDFSGAIEKIQIMNGAGATETFKTDWVAKLAAEL